MHQKTVLYCGVQSVRSLESVKHSRLNIQVHLRLIVNFCYGYKFVHAKCQKCQMSDVRYTPLSINVLIFKKYLHTYKKGN